MGVGAFSSQLCNSRLTLSGQEGFFLSWTANFSKDQELPGVETSPLTAHRLIQTSPEGDEASQHSQGIDDNMVSGSTAEGEWHSSGHLAAFVREEEILNLDYKDLSKKNHSLALC